MVTSVSVRCAVLLSTLKIVITISGCVLSVLPTVPRPSVSGQINLISVHVMFNKTSRHFFEEFASYSKL